MTLMGLLPRAAFGQGTAPITEDTVKPRLTKAPKLVTFVEADYPESEKAAGKTASVVLQIGITANGTVGDVKVIESAGAAFDAAAIDAVKRFVFEPAEIDGAPAPIRINYRYQFVLKEEVPTTAILSGVVRSRPGGEPLAGVTLSLDDGTSTVTDETGRFEFLALAPGKRSVLISRSDLKGLQTQEELVAGQKLEATYEIELLPVGGGDEEQDDLEIVIVAPKLVKQTVSTKIEADEGRRVAGTQGDVLKIVENLPGVARATVGSSAIVVWGAAPEDTRVYVDGMRLPLLYHFGGLRSVLNTDFVQSVELIPGGYGAGYGRGLGGLVVVATRDPPSDRLHGSAQLDIIDASLAVQGPLGDGWSFALAGRHSHLHWLFENFADEDSEFFTTPRYYDGQARIRKDLGKKTFVEVTGLLSSDEISRTVDSSDPQARKQQTSGLDFQRAGFRFKTVQDDGTSVELLPWFGADQQSLDASFGNVSTNLDVKSTLWGLRASYSSKLSETVVTNLGVDVEFVDTRVERTGSTGSPPREGDQRVFGQPPSDQTNTDRWDALIGSAAPFGELDIGLFSDTLHVVPGLRLDPLFISIDRRVPREGDAPGVGAYTADIAIEPRLSVRYALSRRARFKAAYGEYRQPPLPEDLSPAFGNPLLGVAEGRHLLGGGDFDLSHTLSVETTVFYTRSSGLTARNPIPSPLIAEALVGIGEGRSYGAQFLLRRKLADGFFGWVAYTLLRSERQDQPDTPFRLFDFDQTHVLTALAAYQLGKGFDVSARVRYASGYPRTPVKGAYYDSRRAIYEPLLGPKNGDRIPDFVQLDVRFAKRFKIGQTELEAYLDVQNVTNRANPEEIAYSPDYSERRYVEGLPILPVLGARWSF